MICLAVGANDRAGVIYQSTASDQSDLEIQQHCVINQSITLTECNKGQVSFINHCIISYSWI